MKFGIFAQNFKTKNIYKTIDPTFPYNQRCDYPKEWHRQRDLNLTFNIIPYSVLDCPTSWESGAHTGFGAAEPETFLKLGQTILSKIASKFPQGKRKIKIIPKYLDMEEMS